MHTNGVPAPVYRASNVRVYALSLHWCGAYNLDAYVPYVERCRPSCILRLAFCVLVPRRCVLIITVITVIFCVQVRPMSAQPYSPCH